MPAASTSYPRSSRARAGTPRKRPPVASGAAGLGARVRWDRLARIAMLFVLVALAYLYLSAGVRMFSTWRQAHRDSSLVSNMQREHGSLLAKHNALSSQGSLEAEARQLGMMRPGEQPYVVPGLPNN
jgi:hypothetical protein